MGSGMKVIQLFLKPRSGAASVEQAQLRLMAGSGITGDANAQVGSPRQLLLVDLPLLKPFGLQPGDLRENILLDQGTEMWQSGQMLQIGETLIRLTFRCEPCVYLETLQPGLAKQMRGQRGWLGIVVMGGAIAPGDPVTLTSEQLPPLPDDARGRFDQFVARIPPGAIVTTKQLILALGVTPSHYRVIPTFLKQAEAHLPVHRIVAIDGSLFTKHLPHQAAQLAAEGVEIVAGKVSDRHYWQPQNFY